jgi:hypothetical protein
MKVSPIVTKELVPDKLATRGDDLRVVSLKR